MPIRRWVTAQGDKTLSRAIARKFGISPFAAHLLVTRGYTQDEDVRGMLEPTAAPLSDPFGYEDMTKAVERIRHAIEQYEMIAVYGDYDVDGITATALLYSCLEGLGARIMYMLPSRDDGGYGLHLHSIDSMAANGVKLIVTVDNGVSAVDEIAYAARLGIDVIVTDHHRPPEVLPDAAAILDGHIPGNSRCFSELSGVGVAFKLACALEGDIERAVRRYADLVALGTIADAVPLVGENRALVSLGLERLRAAERTGTRVLMNAAGVDHTQLTATNVSFAIAPRLNSAGRIGRPDRAVRLMLAGDVEECTMLANDLCAQNSLRHECEREISEQAWAALEKDHSLADDHVVIISGEGWNSGVIGIFAARLSERMGKPSIVLAIEGDEARGSCRGPEGFSFHQALSQCADLLVVFGGHSQAAGFTIKTENIPEFHRRINEYAASVYIPTPQIMTDCELPLGNISLSLASGLAVLEPFGSGNPAPLITVRGAQLREVRAVGGGGHQRLTLTDGAYSLTAMLFGVSTESFRMRPGDRVDCVLSIGVKTYRGVTSVEAIVRDIRLSAMNCDDIITGERLFERLRRGEDLTPDEAALLLPTREQAGQVYRYIRSSFGKDEPETICARVGELSFARVKASIRILEECGFVNERIIGGRRLIGAPPHPESGSLDSSPTMCRLRALAEKAAGQDC